MATRFVAHIFYMWLQKMSGDEKRFKHARGGVSMAAISTASLKEVHLKKKYQSNYISNIVLFLIINNKLKIICMVTFLIIV